jgi:predicted nucleic acid-binding protein
MAMPIDPGEMAFLDTSYAVALASSTDQFHESARRLAGVLEAEKARLITTRAIVLEIGNVLARQRYRASAITLIDAIENDPRIEIVVLTKELCQHGMELFRNRPDKEWGLIDCISFVVMTERGLTKALTADEHFQQCGFRALLRDADT